MSIRVTGGRALAGEVLRAAVVVGLAVGGYWVWLNFDWLLYHVQRQYDREAYGLAWKVETAVAAEKARRENKELLIVFLQAGDESSEALRSSVFPRQSFRTVENNYVLLLVDFPADQSKMSAREKTFCDELVKRYGVEKFGTLIVAAPGEGDAVEVRKLRYGGESPMRLLDRIAGGRFIAHKPVDSTPRRRELTLPKQLEWLRPPAGPAL